MAKNVREENTILPKPAFTGFVAGVIGKKIPIKVKSMKGYASNGYNRRMLDR